MCLKTSKKQHCDDVPFLFQILLRNAERIRYLKPQKHIKNKHIKSKTVNAIKKQHMFLA